MTCPSRSDEFHQHWSERLWLNLVSLAVRNYRRTLPTDRRHLLDQFRLVHLARKVVGVGRVGTRDWIGLFLGRDDKDPLLLQIKGAGESVLERFLAKSEYTNHGQRVAAGQRLMQTAGDIFLGWDRWHQHPTHRTGTSTFASCVIGSSRSRSRL